VTLPPNIPEKNFWSIILYDNQTRSMLQTGQPYPKVGSLNLPTDPPLWRTTMDQPPSTSDLSGVRKLLGALAQPVDRMLRSSHDL
jgi:hypothetical protein